MSEQNEEAPSHRSLFKSILPNIKKLRSKSPNPQISEDSRKEPSASSSQAKEQAGLAHDGSSPPPRQTETDKEKKKKSEPPQKSLLWYEAYLNLKTAEPDLMAQYEKEAAKAIPKESLSTDKDQLFEEMRNIAMKKQDEIENKKWKVGFEAHKMAIKDLVKPVISVVQWSKDYIGDAINSASYPPASLAWAGVCLLLPLVLNPADQEAARTKAVEEIAEIVWQCAFREERYDMRYGKAESKEGSSDADFDHDKYRSAMRDLYMEILRFQARVVHYWSQPFYGQYARELTKWDDWKGWYGDISKKKVALENLETEYEKNHPEMRWRADWEQKADQHEKTLNELGAVKKIVEEFRADVAKAQQNAVLKDLMGWLRKPMETAQQESKKLLRPEPSPLTSKFSEWLFIEKGFDDWKVHNNSFFWLHGKAGNGKSVLSSNVVQHLEHDFEDDPYTAVAYFFIKFDVEITLDPLVLLKCLIAQLLACRPDLPDPLRTLNIRMNSGSHPTKNDLLGALKAVAEGFTRSYILIDGVDECPNQEDAGPESKIAGQNREKLLEILKEIRRWNLRNIHLFIASRPNKDIVDAFCAILEEDSCTAVDLQKSNHQEKVKADINRYINEQLEGISRFKDAQILKEDIRKSLLDKSNGMFLYVNLQLAAIKRGKADPESKTRELLEKLPSDLYTTFDQIFYRIDQDLRQQAIQILTWIAVAADPIHVDEFLLVYLISFRSVDAMDADQDSAIDLSKPLFKEADKYCGIDYVIDLLPGLLIIEEGIIKLVHFSLFEYLVSKEIKEKHLNLEKKKEKDLNSEERKEKEEGVAIRAFALDLTTARLQVADACFRLFVQHQVAHSNSDDQKKVIAPSCCRIFLHGLHLAELIKLSKWPCSWNQLIKRAFFNAEGAPYPSMSEVQTEPLYFCSDPLPLSLAIGYKFFELLAFLNQNKLVDFNEVMRIESEVILLRPLYFACNEHCRGDASKMFETLIRYGCGCFLPCDRYINIFNFCIHVKNESILRLLKKLKVAEECEKKSYSPLIDAVTMDFHAGMWGIRTIIKNVPNIWQKFDRTSMPAVHTAVALGDFSKTRTLIELGADVRIRNQFHTNTIQLAVILMQFNTIRCLLEQGAILEPEGLEWETTISTVEEGAFLKEGQDGGLLAVERLKLARTIFGDGDHSHDAGLRVQRFFEAAQDPDLWTKTLSVRWKLLAAWNGQDVYAEPTISEFEQLTRLSMLGLYDFGSGYT